MATETARTGDASASGDERSEAGATSASEHLTQEDRVGLLRAMLLMRGIEERAMMLYRQGKVPGSFYDGFGQEAVSAGPTWAMHGHDRLCILHRDLAAHLIRGVTPARIFGQYMGRAGGITGGRDGNVHFGDRRVGCVGMVSMLPDMMLVATGLAMAFKLRGEQRAALTWFGDGSTSRGDFHEAMNWAGVQKLPVIFILENNQYAYSTPTASQFAVDPVERAAAYGFPGVSVDGNDVEAMFEATREAREPRDRRRGPDADRGRDDAHARARRARRHEVRAGRADRGVAAQGPDRPPGQARRGARRRRRGAAHGGPRRDRRGRRGGAGDADARRRDRDRPAVRRRAGAARGRRLALERVLMPTMTYLQAISDGMRQEMREDERVFVMGEDIGVFGGAFKVTDGFLDEFGANRVMDTPLAESAIIGCAIGAAAEGMRPIAEMQFSDFISCGFDQLVNVAGKMFYRQGLSMNITVRLPSGGGFSGGPFHSQNPEAWFMHAPGLKVVAPSTAEDAKGLLIKAVRDPNPVVFMEHKHLYRRVKGEVPAGTYETDFSARVAREGSDLVVIAYGAMVHTALEATADLDASVEVLDLRSLVPLDEEAILDSVRKLLEGRDRRRGERDVRGGRPGRGADRAEGLRGPRRTGRPRRDAGRPDPVLAHAGAGGAAAGRRREGGRA